MQTYNIIRRAHSEYKKMASYEGNFVNALIIALDKQHENKDGEYLVRKEGEPNQSFEQVVNVFD